MFPSLQLVAWLDFKHIAPCGAGFKPGSGVALVVGMGAFLSAFDDKWTSAADLDDGWSLDGEAGVLPRALPAPAHPTIVNLDTCLNYDVTTDWSLASEHERRVPEVSVHSAIVNRLTDDELEEFSRAELAMGTEVGFPVSEELWFEDLRCIVPKRRAPSVSDHPPTSTLSNLPLLAKPEEFALPPVAAPASKKARWWQRLRRS